MSSIIEGYNYDIFISYRQKDNKGEKWVSRFVETLKTELEATLKDDVSVYFDENPHDRLQETHNVDKSLEGKLKCLIFIPILSKTYCDPNSYAWQYEFLSFLRMIEDDRFGRDVKLRGGNVASRILPIRIHELEQQDVKLFEKETGSVLRAMDFVFKTTAGVNRSLKVFEDHPQDNLNKTFYSDQINKLANAIDEIIYNLKGAQTSQAGRRLTYIQPLPDLKKEIISKEPLGAAIINRKSKKWQILLLSVILCVIVVFAVFKIIEGRKGANDMAKLKKSIAVLPFRNDSPDSTNKYFIDGTMEAILNNLCKIADLTVISRTSVEQFRNTNKPIREIAKRLNVNYILEGSGQKYGNDIRLTVQLIDAKNDRHIWSSPYEGVVDNIFKLQSQISKEIASELKAIISPKEKQLIDKIPTTSLTAYDFYQRGKDELNYDGSDTSIIKKKISKAKELFNRALEYDSSFAPAYTGLALVYSAKLSDEEYFSKNFLDSVLILCDIALSFDNQLSEAYDYRGFIYNETGKQEQAIEEFDKAIKFNPNDWMAYGMKGNLYYNNTDLVNLINSFQKAASINRGPELPGLLGQIGFAYFCAGFPEKAKYYYQEQLKLDEDSLAYYSALTRDEFFFENFNKSIELGLKVYAKDSTNEGVLYFLGWGYACLGQDKEALKYYKKWFERLKSHGGISIAGTHNIGYAYWQNGYKKEAEYYFNEQIKYDNKANELKRAWGQSLFTYYDLASVYAFTGEKDKAYKNLRIFNQIQRIPLWMATQIKFDPLFVTIRNEPEFQQIVKDVESKYQAEHERVRKWLEEQRKL